jgi:uroporphyrinogen decarboxylase
MSYDSLENLVRRISALNRQPDFANLLAILRRQIPSRPTPFEFILNNTIYARVTGRPVPADGDGKAWCPYLVEAFYKLGYDYAVIGGWQLNALVFPMGQKRTEKSKSLNEGALITDRASFDRYPWPDLNESRLEPLRRINNELPEGIKMIASGVEGVLEAAIELVGFENLCLMLYTEPDLIKEIFDHIGSRILNYYRHVVQFDSIGAIIDNDDWGFKTQTMLAPPDMRRLIFPWHKKIAETAHAAGKPVILHSCGNLEAVIDDIIKDLKIEGKHSYEDTIIPVEQAIERWGDRIAIIGGIDVDFLTKSTTDQIRQRTTKIIDRSMQKGGIAIGSGNSIPYYIPIDHYCAMVQAVMEWK